MELGREPKILEAGSGNGRVVYYLSKKGCTDVSGIELNEEIVKDLNKKYPDLKIYSGNILEVPEYLRNNDLILSYGVIEHFVDGVERPLKATYDCLAGGGSQ